MRASTIFVVTISLVSNFTLTSYHNVVQKPLVFESIVPGLRKSIIKAGTGKKCATGEHVFAHYTLRALDKETEKPGDCIDSSRNKSYRKRGFYFRLGAKEVGIFSPTTQPQIKSTSTLLFEQVIGAWDVGFLSMRVGEKAILISSPDLGYGRAGMPPMIEPNAWLWYEVEIMGSLRLNEINLRTVQHETMLLRTIAQRGGSASDSVAAKAASATAAVDKIFARSQE